MTVSLPDWSMAIGKHLSGLPPMQEFTGIGGLLLVRPLLAFDAVEALMLLRGINTPDGPTSSCWGNCMFNPEELSRLGNWRSAVESSFRDTMESLVYLIEHGEYPVASVAACDR